MKKYSFFTVAILSVGLFVSGCTKPSTKIAQDGNARSQSVQDGVYDTLQNALSRENYETASLSIRLKAERAKHNIPKENWAIIDSLTEEQVSTVKEFAMKREQQREYQKDHDAANALKYVTVDVKMFNDIGIINYIGTRISATAQKFLNAWDSASQSWKTNQSASSQPTK